MTTMRFMPVAISDEQRIFGQALKAYRMRKAWTLQKISSRTGVAISVIQKLEKCSGGTHDLTRARIRKALPDFDPNGEPLMTRRSA